MKKILPILLLIILFSNCKQDETFLSETPEIELLNVSTNQVISFVDSITFEIQYKDGNGDLGFANGDSLSFHLIDNRNGLVQEFYIPPLTPNNEQIAIQGTFLVTLDYTFIFNSNNQEETTTYTMRIKDRAQNWSNSVTSSEIKILP